MLENTQFLGNEMLKKTIIEKQKKYHILESLNINFESKETGAEKGKKIQKMEATYKFKITY